MIRALYFYLPEAFWLLLELDRLIKKGVFLRLKTATRCLQLVVFDIRISFWQPETCPIKILATNSRVYLPLGNQDEVFFFHHIVNYSCRLWL